MEKVFPDRAIVDVSEESAIMNMHFDVDHSKPVPGIMALRYGVTYEHDGYTPTWKGIYDDDGRPVVTQEALWGMMSYYTRDLRLSNLSYKSNEIQYCQHYLDLAGDFLKEGMLKPFLVCLSRVATITELAQSKGGFLRRQMNTLRTENVEEALEPKKKNIFGRS